MMTSANGGFVDSPPSTKLKLREMTAVEYEIWLPQQTASYAASKVRAGNWGEEGALTRAAEQMAELLPDGPETKGHTVYCMEHGETDETVGVIWVHVQESPRGPWAYLYDIEVEERWRGHGFGSAAIEALEELLRRDGVQSLLLHVFGYNKGAQKLYERLGFEVTNINMAKKL